MLHRLIQIATAPFRALIGERPSTDAEILEVEADLAAAHPLAAAGQAAIDEALRLWRFDIIDPKRSDRSDRANASRGHIEDMVRSCGWDWELPYAGDGDLEWCGLFALAFAVAMRRNTWSTWTVDP